MEDSRVRDIFEYWFGLPLVSLDEKEIVLGLQEVVGEYKFSFPGVVKLLKEAMASSGVLYINK